MKRRNKILYVLTVILYGIAALFALVAVIGIVNKSSAAQIMGLVGLVVSYLTSTIIDFLNKEGRR